MMTFQSKIVWFITKEFNIVNFLLSTLDFEIFLTKVLLKALTNCHCSRVYSQIILIYSFVQKDIQMTQMGQQKEELTLLPCSCVKLLRTSITAIALRESDKAHHQPVTSKDLLLTISTNEKTHTFVKNNSYLNQYNVNTLITKN